MITIFCFHLLMSSTEFEFLRYFTRFLPVPGGSLAPWW